MQKYKGEDEHVCAWIDSFQQKMTDLHVVQNNWSNIVIVSEVRTGIILIDKISCYGHTEGCRIQ